MKTMTKDEVYHLDINKLYVFELYTGKIYYGLIEQDYARNEYFIVENNKLSEYRDSKLTREQKIINGIMMPINIDTIQYWEEQSR